MHRLTSILFYLTLCLGELTQASLDRANFCGMRFIRPTVGSPTRAPSSLSQLTRMTTRPEAATAGVPNLRLSFIYDYAGRRVLRELSQKFGGAGSGYLQADGG